MEGKLTQDEAIKLLQMLKKTLVKDIGSPVKGDATEFDVVGKTKRILFTIRLYRGKINPNKYEIGARIKKDGILLLELHINPGKPHKNPDGTKLIGSHWHIYTEKYYRRYAIPADDIDSDDFIENTLAFFEMFNLITTPFISCQSELQL